VERRFGARDAVDADEAEESDDQPQARRFFLPPDRPNQQRRPLKRRRPDENGTEVPKYVPWIPREIRSDWNDGWELRTITPCTSMYGR
jgi:hypothetical protein